MTHPRLATGARLRYDEVREEHLLGRGLVEPIDDFRDTNPPVNPPLLAALVDDFVAHGYDLRHTIRVDYYHTGNAKEERFSIDRVVLEPLSWPGNPARPIDQTNRGKYFFEVVDAATGAVAYSRGFSSICWRSLTRGLR